MGEVVDSDKVSFRLRGGMRDDIDRMADNRKVDRSVILNEAIQEYIERKKNPEILKEQIRQALREDPAILDEAIKKMRLEIKPSGF